MSGRINISYQYTITLLLLINNLTITRNEFTTDELYRCRNKLPIPNRDEINPPFDRPLYEGWNILKANTTQNLIFNYTFKDCLFTNDSPTVYLTGDQTSTRSRISGGSGYASNIKSTDSLLKNFGYAKYIYNKSSIDGILSPRFSHVKKFLSGKFNGKKMNDLERPTISVYFAHDAKYSAKIEQSGALSEKLDVGFKRRVEEAASILSAYEVNSTLPGLLETIIDLYGTHYWKSGLFGTSYVTQVILTGNKTKNETFYAPVYKISANGGELIIVGEELIPLSRLITADYFPNEEKIIIESLSYYLNKAIQDYYRKNVRKGCTVFAAINFDVNHNVDDGSCIGGRILPYGNVLYIVLQSILVIYVNVLS